jgi:hypothetical protein
MNEKNFIQKKKQHTIKNLVITDKDGFIVFISPTFRGKVHDKLIADLLPITKSCTLLTDLGFYGWKLPNTTLVMPNKKPKKKALTKIQKVQNKLQSRQRVKIENTFANLKILRIVKERIRTYIEETKNKLFELAVALYNFRRTCALKRKIIYL